MKKKLLSLIFYGLGLSISALCLAESNKHQTEISSNIPSTDSIFAKYQSLHPDKKALDDSIWNDYLNPQSYTLNSMNQVMELLYAQILEQINTSTEINESEKEQYRKELDLNFKSQAPDISPSKDDFTPLFSKAYQYAIGKDVKQNDIKANDILLEIAEENHNGDALELVAIRAIHGIGKGNEQSDAMEAFERLAQDYGQDTMSPIWAYLSYGYTYGIGVNKNLVKAKEYWDIAKRHYSLHFDRTGFVGYMMGQMIEENTFLNETTDQAMEYYIIATRANENNIAAQQAILNLLKTPKLFKELTYETELFIAEARAKRNEAEAFFTLSELYAQKKWDIYSPKKAIEFLEKSAALGYDNAYIDLGRFYANGHLVELNSKKAIEWYKKGFQKNLLASGILLIDLYENGNTDMSKDLKKAKAWESKVTNAYIKAGYPPPLPKATELRINRKMY